MINFRGGASYFLFNTSDFVYINEREVVQNVKITCAASDIDHKCIWSIGLQWVPMILVTWWPGVEPNDGSKKNESLTEVKHWLTSFDILTLIVTFFHGMKWSSDQSIHSPNLRGKIISSPHSKRYPSLHSFIIELIQLVYLNPKLPPAKVTTARAPHTPLDVCN